MDIKTLIRTINELEKLKLLLFDDSQLVLFEHIPRPFLVNPNLNINLKKLQEQQGGDQKSSLGTDTERRDEAKSCSLSKDKFWHKIKTSEINFRDYMVALESIRAKGKNMNIIDERLFHALNIPLPLSYTEAKENQVQSPS